MDEPRPTVEAVLARQRMLRRRERRRWIGGAKCAEMFFRLFAKVLERRAWRKLPERGNGHDDLLSDSARVRSTG
jgi:hypothetical protein